MNRFSILVKRTQELLMFGNQQNRQTENNAASSFSSPAEKSEFYLHITKISYYFSSHVHQIPNCILYS